MFPLLVDMTEDESWKVLRFLELEAYSSLVTALRAQGSLNSEKMKFIKEAGNILHISEERFKSELKRVVLDERLNTVAYYVTGSATTWEDWVQEGRSVIPPLPRAVPQTAYLAIADQVAEDVSKSNDLLPPPAFTERKRGSSFSQSNNTSNENNKVSQFRVPEAIKSEDGKKRKSNYGLENNSLSHHLMSAPKVSRIQQIYRQRTKAKLKEQQQMKNRQQEQEQKNYQRNPHPLHHQKCNPPYKQHKLPLSPQPPVSVTPKINILQNISITSPKVEETIEMIKNEIDSYMAGNKNVEQSNVVSQPGCSNENEAPKNVNSVKTSQAYKVGFASSPSSISDAAKTVKVCPIRKQPSTKAVTTSGQKLIIVSNPQTLTTPSILQRTLTIPFVKNISMKNFDKFKIVSTATTPVTLNLTAVTNAVSQTTGLSKQKVLSLKSNTLGKKIISLSHLQALTGKSGIKMLPLGTKLVTTRGPIVNSSTAPVYIANSTRAQTSTKNTIVAPVMATSRVKNKSEDVNVKTIEASPKVEISRAEHLTEDIESQISQLTAIPKNFVDKQVKDTEVVEQVESGEAPDNGIVQEEYVIEQEGEFHEGEIIHEEMVHENDIQVDEQGVFKDNHYVEEQAMDGCEIAEVEGEIIEGESVIVHEKYDEMQDTFLAQDSGDGYIIIDKSSDVAHFVEETDYPMDIVDFDESGKHKESIDFGEIEITSDNNCTQVQTNMC